VRWPAWAWASLAVSAATIPFLPGITGSRVFYIRDLSMVFWGRYLWLRHELLSGSFPLWDPYVGAGQSAVADALHQLFLLPALAVRLIGSDVLGFNLWVATPFPLAALGAWLFFRRRFGADASALGAIAFSLSGPIVSTGNFPNLSWSAAAIPWMLWAVDRVATTATPRHIAALALVTSCQAFAGEPVTLFATLVVALAFAAFVCLPPGVSFARQARLMASVAFGLGLGLAVAAVQLVPLGRAASMSERSVTVGKDFWSLHPLALVEIVSLHLYGDFFTSQNSGVTPWLAALNSGREPLLFSIYLGVPLLSVALFGFVRTGPRRWTVFWCSAGVASLLSALGAHTPVYPFVRDHLPLLPFLRFPAKYLVVLSMVVAAGAAAGWEAIGRGGAGPRFARARFASIGLALTIGTSGWVAAAACMYLSNAAAGRLFALARSLGVADPVAAAVFMLRALPHAASSLLLLSAIAAVLLFAGARTHQGAPAARAVLFGLIAVDLVVNAWSINPTFNPAYLAEPAWLSLTHGRPDSRFYIGGKTDGTLDASDLDASSAYLNPPGLSGSASRAALSSQANFYPSGWRRREMLSYDLAILWPRDFATMSKRFFQSGRLERDLLLDRTGVRYRVLPRGQAGGRTPLAQVPYTTESFLFDYGTAEVAPRVAVISTTQVVGDAGQEIERLFEPGWDIRSTAIIDHEPAAAGDARPPVPPSALITTDTPNRVVVEAGVGESGGYVVMLDSYSDDWHATADGHPATVVRANGLFRAVRLNPGSHVVEFRYRPRAFLAGATVSAVALVMLLGLVVWPMSNRRAG
jgi:Bacterial membrane protein YfhO